MTKIKDKIVTVESLASLHEHNKKTYMTKVNPVGNGNMIMEGNAVFSEDMNVNSLTMGTNVRIIATNSYLKIEFIDETTTGVKLLSSDDFILKDIDGVYLTSKEDE